MPWFLFGWQVDAVLLRADLRRQTTSLGHRLTTLGHIELTIAIALKPISQNHVYTISHYSYIYIYISRYTYFPGFIYWTVIPNYGLIGYNDYSYQVSTVEECLDKCMAYGTCLSAEYYNGLCQVSSATPVTLQWERNYGWYIYVPCFMTRVYGRWNDEMVQLRFDIQKSINNTFPYLSISMTTPSQKV